MTVVVFLDTQTVSSSAMFRSSLLGMCIGVPEPTTKSLSSGFLEVGAGAGDDQISEGEYRVVLSLSLRLWTFFAISDAMTHGKEVKCTKERKKVKGWSIEEMKDKVNSLVEIDTEDEKMKRFETEREIGGVNGRRRDEAAAKNGDYERSDKENQI